MGNSPWGHKESDMTEQVTLEEVWGGRWSSTCFQGALNPTPPPASGILGSASLLCRGPKAMSIHPNVPRWSGSQKGNPAGEKTRLVPLPECPPRSPAAALQDTWPCPIQSGSQRTLGQLQETDTSQQTVGFPSLLRPRHHARANIPT